MQWSIYRDVALDPHAQSFVDEAAERIPRFDEQWRGIEWFLARRPEKGTPRYHHEATKYLVYVFPGNRWAKTRELWVLYSYDDDRVIIHLVRFGGEEE